MIEAFFRYVARALALILEKYADPDLDAKLKAHDAKTAALEAKAREAQELAAKAEAEYQAAEANRKEWETKITDSLARQAALRTQREESQRMIDKLEAEIADIQIRAEGLNEAVRIRTDDEAFSKAPK